MQRLPLYLEGGTLIGSYQLVGDGTCLAFIDNPEFKEWLDSDRTSTFSISPEHKVAKRGGV